MDKLLHDLGGIVVNGLPTAFLVLVLAVYLKYIFFQPLDRVLQARYSLTEGAQKAAEKALQSADSRVSEYEGKLDGARAAIYRDQEEYLHNLHNEQAEKTRSSRRESELRLAEIKAALARETEAANASLAMQSEMLASQIADSILNRRVA